MRIQELMSETVPTVGDRGMNRLPVVEGGKLMKIVTRKDLVRAFTRSDEEIETELREDVLERTMWIDAGAIDVVVERGAVALFGRLYTRGDAELLARLAARIPGVTSVLSTVEWKVDDTTRNGTRALGAPAW